MESIKLAKKTYKSGFVVIYSPNSGDFRRFQSKLTKIEVEIDVKKCKNKKNIVVIKWPIDFIKLAIEPIKVVF